MPQYTYDTTSVSPFEIRLLTIAPGNFDSNIVCELHTHRLDKAPQYEALSYTWGTDEPASEISLSGCRYLIRENLHTALRCIREASREKVLWIDALCINQENLEERSQQVTRISSIFRAALRILAWTGPSNDQSDQALDLMEEFGRVILSLFQEFDSPSVSSLYHHFSIDALRKRGFDASKKNWPALAALWKRHYWTRIWVIQELSCCHTGPWESDSDYNPLHDRGLIGCGTKWIPFQYFVCSIFYFDYYATLYIQDIVAEAGQTFLEQEPWKTINKGSGAVYMSRALRVCGTGGKDLYGMIRATSVFKATDVRDKIFALLNLASNGNEFTADYTKPAAEVFQDLVAQCIQNHQNRRAGQLQILYGNRNKRVKFGPSWIPEPDGSAHTAAIFSIDYMGDLVGSGGAQCEHMPRIDKGILTLHGFSLSIVKDIVGPLDTADMTELPPTDESTAPGRFWHALMEYNLQLSTERWELFWRALLGDRDNSDPYNIIHPAPKELEMQARVYFRGDGVPGDFMPDGDDLFRFISYASSINSQVSQNLLERCFFETRDGHMGIGPMTMSKGDKIVVFLGGHFCFVLRSVHDKYELIGDAYVQGVMNGELLDQLKSGKIMEEWFSLC